jgi:hypothetical protein
MINCLIHHKTKNVTFSFVNIYGAAQAEHRSRFLNEFSSVCSNCKGPSIFGGDFNIIRTNEEKNKPVILSRCSALFNSIIEMHGLIDLDLSDRLYTWSNNRNNPTFEKLDRFLVNPEWDLMFHNATVRGLDRSLSDHVPLVLQTEEKKKIPHEFRYELSWKFRPKFNDIVRTNWNLPVRSKNSIDIWKEKVKRLKKTLKGWNINEEGFNRRKINTLKMNLNRLDIKNESKNLSDKEKNEKMEYEFHLKTLLLEEETKMIQIAREKNIIAGDENTKYFYLKANGKKASENSFSAR